MMSTVKTKQIDIRSLPVYVINLKEDAVKRESIRHQLESFGFKDITFFPGVRHKIKKLGVATSHNKLLKHLQTLEDPYPCLVLEDDVSIYDKKDFISVPLDADAFYLGHSSFGIYGGVGQKQISLSQLGPDLFKIHNMLAAHAIVYLNNRYVEFLDQATEFQISIIDNQDKARAQTMKYWNVYASQRPMFYQNGVHEALTKIILPGKNFGGPERSHTI